MIQVMKEDRKSIHKLIVYVVGTVILLFYIEQGLTLPYLWKTLIKLPLFVVIPWLVRGGSGWSIVGQPHKKEILTMMSGAIFVVSAILLIYHGIATMIDQRAIVTDLTQRMVLGPQVLVIAAIYTTLVNAFVEEYFFRGVIFLGLKHRGKLKLGYFLSAATFALYHVGIFMTWFSLPLMGLALAGLFLGGLIFAWFADRTDSLLGSWVVHMSADAALMWVGFWGLQLFSAL